MYDFTLVLLLFYFYFSPLVSWADLIQMGGALGVELAGGPKIDMIYGRQDGEGKSHFFHTVVQSLIIHGYTAIMSITFYGSLWLV